MSVCALIDRRAYADVKTMLQTGSVESNEALERAVWNRDWAMVVLLFVHGARPCHTFQSLLLSESIQVDTQYSRNIRLALHTTLYLLDLCAARDQPPIDTSAAELLHHLNILKKAEEEFALTLRMIEKTNYRLVFDGETNSHKVAVLCVNSRLAQAAGAASFSAPHIVKRILMEVYRSELWSKLHAFEAQTTAPTPNADNNEETDDEDDGWPY